MKILIVDDDDLIRRIASVVLARADDMEVVEASSGADGLAVAEKERPDVILLDVLMQSMDGPATLAALRANAATAAIPVIFLTGRARAGEVEQLMAMGAAGVLAKPFDPASLASQVRSVLNSRS